MSAVVDQIENAVRAGVLDVLAAEGGPMTPSALAARAESAADLADVRAALRRLITDRRVVKVQGRYRLPATDGPPGQRAHDAGPQRPIRRAGDAVAGVLEAEGGWLTIAEIEPRVAGLDAEQIRSALGAAAFVSRACARGHASAREYGLARWADRPAVAAEPAGELDATAPPGPPPGPRYGLFSDGALAIHAAAGTLTLAPAETAALVAYLIRQRAEIRHVFDAEAITS